MHRWQMWTLHHPVAFWLSLVGLSLVLGLVLPVDFLFFVAALVSAGLWQVLAAIQVPKVEASNARTRMVASRTQADSAPLLHLPPPPWVLLPRGRKIQVTKEEHHSRAVGELLGVGDGPQVAATLHILEPSTPRSTKDRVEVRVSGSRVGELTPYMSEHFLPVVRACDRRGVTVVCAAVVKGNKLRADVVLDTSRAVDLDDDWIDRHVPDAGLP